MLNTNRVVRVVVGGKAVAFRRPSRADQAAVVRAFARKVAPSTGAAVEGDTLVALDRESLWWEARLEVGLVPAKNSAGDVVDLGESAPAHWLIDAAISFAEVELAEFHAVCEAIAAALDGGPISKRFTSNTAAMLRPSTSVAV